MCRLRKFPHLLFPCVLSNNGWMTQDDQKPTFSPMVERLLPDAPIEKKIEAQANLDAFMEVMYRIYLRFEEEGRFPLPEDGSLTKSENMQ